MTNRYQVSPVRSYMLTAFRFQNSVLESNYQHNQQERKKN